MSNPDQGAYRNAPMQALRLIANPTTGINTVVSATPGYLHSITLSQIDAAPTAGLIGIYDSVTSYGTAASTLFTHGQTTAVFLPVTVDIGIPFSTGLTLGITGMGDVNVIVKFKQG